MREVAILGIGQTMFGQFPDIRGEALALEAARAALKDSGLSARQIQVAYTARMQNPGQAYSQRVLMNLGISEIEMHNVENACAGGSSAVHALWKDIAYGVHDAGIAIGVEDMVYPKDSGRGTQGKALAAEDDLDADMGISMPTLFATMARRMMDLHGATREDFARVSVKSRRHAMLNPFAHFKKEVTLEEVLASRTISDPITLFQCCPISDGAAAVILCSMDVARKFTSNPVKLLASVLMSGGYNFRQQDINVAKFAEDAPRKAYEIAGIGPEDVDVVEIHDAFAPEEIIRYEDLGLCKRGEGAELLRSGATTLGGRVPVNVSGGLISLGHPLSASGVRVVVDIARQIRGQAGKAQVTGAKVGLAHMLGGVVSGLEGGACGIQIIGQ